MKKRIISGIFAALFAVSAVTGISAASDSVFQEEIQDADGDEDIFMPGDETEKADDEEFSEDADGDSAEISETDFEENMEPDSFDVTVRAEQGTIVFETDLLQLKEEQEKLSADELL